jgi:diadenylate cyclase
VADILWVLSRLHFSDVIDILLVATVLYALLQLIKGTQAIQLLRGVIIFIFLAELLSSMLSLSAFSWSIRNAVPALLVAIPVIFQPELRRALERLGRAGGLIDRPMREAVANRAITQVARACRILSNARHGAIIVLERNTGLQDYADTGVRVDAQVSSEMLLTIFYPNTALHDGAVIVREDRIVAAAALLPLYNSRVSDRHLGTRHRAGLGISEQTDAISVVVSEETGTISVAHNGRMVRHLDENRLRSILQQLYHTYPQIDLSSWLQQRVGGQSEAENAREPQA